MGFFDKLKASVGIGQPKMALTLDSTQVQRGTALKGKFTLTAKDREVPIKQFEVELIQTRTTREWSDAQKDYVNRKHNSTIVKKEIPKNGYVLKANESISDEFSFEVSDGILPTGSSISYAVKVAADIPGLDASDRLEVYVA
jgi:sporulation-control protein spo0M